ncbi:unnamed protein product (macronuclear) [Paramecium tetraurelia]|uniref:Uncharacterized protein n=1 Tax=Paramecium tetraurelia TaxID=5888 RepID=A0E4X7_PARTE|nr:uncharacterized protein GSPATT00023520001 [Paramecium tetraurelia]CAK90344.1 unnamed protein product [Paramecium tetraurelia]|eukprot:XP_001457741.1 hypothetical protein (macronuclear) [Paramecium tetraurelia strain d4-2]
MNCTQHIQNQVSFICIAPHNCQCQRKLCAQCQYGHGVDQKYTVPIEIFEDIRKKKFQGSYLNSTSELTIQRMNFKKMLASALKMLKQIWDELAESIKQIYDLIEMEDKSYLNYFNNNVNPSELSYTQLEKLVQIIIGNALEDWNIEKNSQLKRLEMKKNYWEMEMKGFCQKLNKEMKEIRQIIQKTDNSFENIQSNKEIVQIYNGKQDLYQVLTQTKNIDGYFLNQLILMLKKEKITNFLEFFSEKSQDQTLFQFITNLMYNISEIDFNKENYSTENYEQIRKDLIKQISYDQHISEFLKFLVHLTAIDKRFLQCGSNSLHLLVEMKVDLRKQNFENIRIRDTSIVGGNFVRCNFNGSEFDNVDISGVNLNQASLFNCKWKNIKIHELNKLNGHSGTINTLCFSPDGTTLASGSDDISIRLWDVKTGQQIAKIDGHSHYVMSVNFSPDGTTLASGSEDNSIRLWNVKTGQLKAKLDGHSSTVYSVNFSPDGTTLASGSRDKSIRLWDVKTGQQKDKLDGHLNWVYSVIFSPDGTTLASGSVDNSIRLWDVKTGQQRDKLDGHSNWVYSVIFSLDGTTLASGGRDNSICLWDVKTGQQRAKLDGHLGYVYSINFSPDGTTLASGSVDSSIRLWDVKTGQLKDQSISLLMVRYQHLGSVDNSIRLWDGQTGQQNSKLYGHLSCVNQICFSPDGTTLASGSSDNSIRLWNVKTGEQKAKLEGHSSDVYSVNFSPDGTMLASGSADNSIRLWDAKTGQQIAKIYGHSNGIISVNFSPDSNKITSGSVDKSVRLWDVKTGQQYVKLDGHLSIVTSVNFSPDGTTLASGSRDSSIRFWDVQTGQQKAKLDGHSGYIYSVNFSPDGTTLASGSVDNSIRFWDVQTGQQKAKLDGHTGYVYSVNFSPDGTTLASGGSDNSIRLWDVKTRQQIAKFDGHSHYVKSVCFSPDSTTLASASRDNSIRLWDVKTAKEILLQDNFYKDLHSQFQMPHQSSSFLLTTRIDGTILRICQNPILEALGTLILKGELVNYQGRNLKSLFQSKGSFIFENNIELKQKNPEKCVLY